jgi:hypothetical protein
LHPSRAQSARDLRILREAYGSQPGMEAMTGMIDKEIKSRAIASSERLAALQAELQSAALAVKARAVRQPTAVTAEAKADIARMLDAGGSIHGVAQWIVANRSGDLSYWQAMTEYASMRLASVGPLSTNKHEAESAHAFAFQVEQAIANYSPATYTEAEQEAAREAQEVQACQGLLEVGLKDARSFLERESQGLEGIVPDSLPRWPGLPTTDRPNGLLEPGRTYLPLKDQNGAFVPSDVLVV